MRPGFSERCEMDRAFGRLVGLAAVLLIPTAWQQRSAAPTADRLRIEGAIEKPVEWTPALLAETFAQDTKEVNYKIKDRTFRARGIPLLKILQRASLDVD